MKEDLFYLQNIHASWQPCIKDALNKLEPAYINELSEIKDWLPGAQNIFNAFSLPVDKVNYVLFGESPYPRAASANGYAFWDAAVKEIWSPSGLSKKVNRATSLRNIIKMLLIAEGKLNKQDTTQDKIAELPKSELVQTNEELFQNFINHGFLLLNATLVLEPNQVKKHARAWNPFVKSVLEFLFQKHPHVQLILLGNIANMIDKLVDHFEIKRLYAEHPYNISFINNEKVIEFFKPLHLLRRDV